MRTQVASFLAMAISLAALTIACGQPSAPAATKAPEQPKATTAAVAPTKAAEPASTKAAVPATPAAASKSDWPKSPITVIVPWPAGGGADVGVRVMLPAVEKELGVPTNVVNKAGAGSQIGLTDLAKSKPDGYTLSQVSLPAGITMYLDPERKAAFGFKDLAPVALQVFDPGTIAVRADSKYKTLKDLVDDAKANPEKVKLSDSGILSDDHLAVMLLEKAAGVKFAQTHFDGGPPAINAVLGGHTDAMCENVGVVAAQVKSGEMRFLGVMDNEKSKFFPDVPTFKSQGYNIVSASSRGYIYPAGVPAEAMQRMQAAIEKAIKDPEHIKKMDEMALQLKYMNSAEFTKYWTDLEAETKGLLSSSR